MSLTRKLSLAFGLVAIPTEPLKLGIWNLEQI
jgi:hypothetical protein